MARLRKRADGRYQKAVTIHGKRYTVLAADADGLRIKENELRDRIEKGYERRNNPTFAVYVSDWTDRRRDSVKESTLRAQGVWLNTICAVMIPDADKTFGELHLSEIRPADCFTLQTELQKDHSTRTTNDYMALVRQILEDARKQRTIDYNPTDTLKKLRRTEPAARDTIHRALSEDEVNSFREAFKDSYYLPLADFLLATGCRMGEACCLRQCDIKSDHIEITATVTRTTTGLERGESGKTKAAERNIPLNDEIKDIIARQQAQLNILNGGNVVRFDGLLFSGMQGGLLSPNVFDRAIKAACIKAEIEPFTSHSFRATFISRAIAAGLNPKIVADLVGHDDLSMTLKLYGHSYEDDRKNAMEKMSEIRLIKQA